MEIPKIIITSERGEQMASTEVVDHAAAQEDVDATEQELLMWSHELAINSPRYRRRSSIHFDAVHDVGEHRASMAPAQLYSTFSGRLYHAGRIVIVLVGPPARGKTHISVSLARYLGWLGVKTRVYHLGDYRRATLGEGAVPDDYFHRDPSPSTQLLRQRILKQCRNDIFRFLNDEKGQVAIYDAVNPIAEERAALAKEFQRDEVKTLFLESLVLDQAILEENVSNVKLSSPDFAHMDRAAATKLYLERLHKSLPVFETLSEREDFAWIKVVDAGFKIETHDKEFTFIHKRIILYLMNLHNKSKKIFFARAGRSSVDRDIFQSDSSLSSDGVEYAKILTKTLLEHRKEEHAEHIKLTGHVDEKMKPLDVWTSQRKRTVETAQFLVEAGCNVDSKSQLVQLNPGVLEKLSPEELDKQYPDERKKHAADPYHHRWPRGESYHDLAVRLESVIFELERKRNDVLIIAHESVLRVIYGYMMACAAMDIPTLKFPRNEIVEIVPGSYTNEAARIIVPGIPEEVPSLTSPGVGALNLPICTTPSGANTPQMTTAEPGKPPKPSMLKDSLLNVQDSYEPVLSVEDAVIGSEEYFPPIQEESEDDGKENRDGDQVKLPERKDSKDMTEDIAKTLATSTIN